VGWTDKLLAAVPSSGEGATLTDITELLDEDRRKWHKSFTQLLDSGRITRTGKGDRYNPFRHLLAAVPDSRPDAMDGGDGSAHPSPPSSRIHTAAATVAANGVQESVGTAGTDELTPSVSDADGLEAVALAEARREFAGVA
jgi:hypothetical protein